MATQTTKASTTHRPIQAVDISSGLIEAALREGNEVSARVVQGLPEGAKLTGVLYRGNDVWRLEFEHASFPLAAQGEEPPLMDIIMERTGD